MTISRGSLTEADRAPERRPRWSAWAGVALELGFVAVALACYLLVRWHTAPLTDQAVANAREVLAVERILGLDWERAIQDYALAHAWLAEAASQYYVWGYFPVLVPVMVWLYVRHRGPYRTMRNALLASGAMGLLVYAFFPCAPPWVAVPGFVDTVSVSSLGDVARPSSIANVMGAMPSFHCGWLALAGVVVYRTVRSVVVRAVCVLHPAITCYVVVATGNHWVLDVPAGLVVAGLGLVVAAYLPRLRAR